MTPADDLAPEQLVGKRVAFRQGEEHAGCWHAQVGLRRGVVRKVAQSLAQKAEMVAAEEGVPEGWDDYEDVPRVWVKADPCEAFPRGCEAAAEPACLLVLKPGEE
jgi:hypothetical protein